MRNPFADRKADPRRTAILAQTASTVLELLGLAALVLAAWLFDRELGLVAVGLALLFLGFTVDVPRPSDGDGEGPA